MSDTMKTIKELAHTGELIGTTLKAGLSKEWGVLEEPYPIALYYHSRRYDGTLRTRGLEELLGAYYGLCLQEWVQKCLDLHKDLTVRGFISEENPLFFHCDCAIYALADREVVPEPLPDIGGITNDPATRFLVRSLVLRTQSRRFIVVFNQIYTGWHIHIREFWETPCVTDPDDLPWWAEDLAEEPLSLKSIAKYSGEACETYGDAFEGGAEFPQRPLLTTYLAGSMIAGREDASIGLRYGDGRDPGYIASLDWASDMRVSVKDAFAVPYGMPNYVLLTLDSAKLELDEE